MAGCSYLTPMLRLCGYLLLGLLGIVPVAAQVAPWVGGQAALPGAIYRADTTLLPQLLAELPDSLRPFLTHPDSFRLQVIYTRLVPVGPPHQGNVRLEHHTFNLDSASYFFPASTLKLPLAALALEQLSRWGWPTPWLDRRVTFGAPDTCRQARIAAATHAPQGYPTLRYLLQDLLVYSDNPAYHRLLDFVGAQAFHHQLAAKGFGHLRINRYPSQGCLPDRLTTYGMVWTCSNGLDTAVHLAPRAEPPPSPNLFCNNQVGLGVMNDEYSTIAPGPLDFSYMSSAHLADLHGVLLALTVPQAVPAPQRFAIRPDLRAFLLQTLAQEPDDLRLPGYDSAFWAGHPGKYLYWGALRDKAYATWRSAQDIPPVPVTIVNKVGQAYGFLSDVAYLHDDLTGAACVVSVTLYVNADGILNDDQYEYATRGWPFMAWLGRRLLRHTVQTRPWPGVPFVATQ